MTTTEHVRIAAADSLLAAGGKTYLEGRASPSPTTREPTAPGRRESFRARFFLSLLVVEVFREVAQDDLVERLVAHQVLAEDRLALLRPRLPEDGRRAGRRIATLGRAGRRRLGTCGARGLAGGRG